MLDSFRIRSFRFQWGADSFATWASEMETLLLGWYVLVDTGSPLLVGLVGALRFGGTLLSGPWPEATQAAVLAVCGGFTYAALRWRTGSIWPVVLLHSALGCAYALYSPGALLFLAVLLLGTFGFVLYGLFLLRNALARMGGVQPPQETTREPS